MGKKKSVKNKRNVVKNYKGEISCERVLYKIITNYTGGVAVCDR